MRGISRIESNYHCYCYFYHVYISSSEYLIIYVYNLIFIYVNKQTLFPAEKSWLAMGLADLSAQYPAFLEKSALKKEF